MKPQLAVVIPCFRVRGELAQVLERIGPEVAAIYCVIDGCPDGSEAEARSIDDARIKVLVHAENRGVGRAVLTGYRQALADGATIIVKLDGDGQMAPEDVPRLVEPIARGAADYTKGNRFFYLTHLRSMPWLRLLGNTGLTFLSKLSSGYWNLFDPTNGFTAIDGRVAKLLCEEKLAAGYFFESDVLFRLNTLRAVVQDVPLPARYANERSNLSLSKSVWQFSLGHFRNFAKRVFINYFLRDFNAASINLLVGFLLLGFGVMFGALHWIRGYELNVLASPGTVMLAALPVILGWQSLLNFVFYDTFNMPKLPLQSFLPASRDAGDAPQPAVAQSLRRR